MAASAKGGPSKEITEDQDLEEAEEDIGPDGDAPIDDKERRANIRAERRRRMEERERTRAEKSSLETKKTGGAAAAGAGNSVSFGDTTQERVPGDINRMKQMQMEDDDDLRLHASNMPAYGDYDEEVAAQQKTNALKGFNKSGKSMGTTGGESPMDSPSRTNRTTTARSEEDGGMSREELQNMAASDDQNAWKSAFSKVRHGKKNDLVSMLDAGCPTDLKDGAGNTLLNVAAQNGQKSIIKAVLRRGAALNTQNHNGQTPLHFCFTYGYEDLGKYLISKGADDTVQNFAGLTCYEGLGE